MNLKTYMEDISNAFAPLSKKDLELIKDNLNGNDLIELEESIKEIFEYPNQTITIYPKILSNDPHEYESISLYSWPNPDTADGLPYIMRDGYVNFENLKKDKQALRTMSFVVYIASIMFYLTNDEKYYDVIKGQITSFFIDEKTKMNPSLAHSQAHPGLNNGQSGGIIDMGVSFGYTLSVLNALKEENMLDEKLVKGLSLWINEMIEWLCTHPNALEMKTKKNNHSMVYDNLILELATFVERYDLLEEVNKNFFVRCHMQIEDDGSMPLELARPKARSYTMMNTRLWMAVGKHINGAYLDEKIIKMVNYYMPYGKGEKTWPFSQTQYYHKFYDLWFMYHAFVYFGFDNKTIMTNKEIHESDFVYLLFKNILNIEEGKEE